MKIHQGHNFILIVLLTISLLSCKDNPTEKIPATDGIWRSVGYGRTVTIENGEFLVNAVTDISCLPVLDGNISDFGDNLSVENDTLLLKDGINIYYFTRLEDITAICKEELPETKKKDPQYNFEVLASTFKDHYAYFELRNVDWKQMYNKYRLKVTDQTTEPQLYRIMEDMLDEFNDGHIGLDATDSIEDAAELLRPKSTEQEKGQPAVRYSNHKVANAIADRYLKNKKSGKNNMVQWGVLDGNIGYMQLNQMLGMADYGIADSLKGRDYWVVYFEIGESKTSEEHTSEELKGTTGIMNDVMSDLLDTRAMIIDLRFNGGGKDEVGLEVMRRFNPKNKTVFTKKARNGNSYTKAVTVKLEKDDEAYTKQVYLQPPMDRLALPR